MVSKITQIFLICGGTTSAREYDVLSSCEVLSVSINREVTDQLTDPVIHVSSQAFPSLNRPRRGATIHKVFHPATRQFNFVILGGCSAPGVHLTSAEIYDETKNQWKLNEDVLKLGKSCFTSYALNGQEIVCFGGWNGKQCLDLCEIVNIDQLHSNNAGANMEQGLHNTNPFRAGNSYAKNANACQKNRLNFPLKNSCLVSSTNAEITSSQRVVLVSPTEKCLAEPNNSAVNNSKFPVFYLVGGWDGKRTLDSIYKLNVTTCNCAPRPCSGGGKIIETKLSNTATTNSSSIIDVDKVASSQNFAATTSITGPTGGRHSEETIHFAAEPVYFKSLPYSVECHCCNTFRQKFFILTGGFDGESVTDKVLIDCLDRNELFDRKLCKLNSPRECHCAEILVDRYVVVIGGWDGYKALKSVEVYEIVYNTSTLKSASNNNNCDLKFLASFDDALIEARNRACSCIV